MLRRVDRLPVAARAVDAEASRVADEILADVRAGGEAAVRAHALRLGDLGPDEPLVVPAARLRQALDLVGHDTRVLLARVAERITAFAEAQRRAVVDVEVAVPGGRAGLRYRPVDTAGCYAPGGRYPLPSTVLMTVLTARAAGVGRVVLASPRAAPATLAAAALAGVDVVLGVGGAQGVGAMAYGVGVPRCDVIVGPGNRFVTAAKQRVAGDVGIDMLAGPSELLVVADRSADPARVAADLLAQAEHDADARVMLVALDPAVVEPVVAALRDQLRDLPTAEVARAALQHSCALVATEDDAVAACNDLAPEHLALHVERPEAFATRLRHYGALFLGEHAAEVLGDYGIGPNHTLPTGGTARSAGCLNVLTFLRPQTWLRVDEPAQAAGVVRDAVALGRLEGLEAHARSAARRLS